jgi:outer membrane protein W
VGDLDLDILSATARLHFGHGSLISPYIGGGVAYISGEAGSIDPDELESVDLESEVNFLANAGINVNLGHSVALFLDGKYILYDAREEGTNGEALDINPLIISGGLKFPFCGSNPRPPA